MTIVVDAGCACYHESHDSLRSLIDHYHPSMVYAFDIAPDLEQLTGVSEGELDGTPVELRRAAVWTADGRMSYLAAVTRSTAGEGGDDVDCIDFSSWLGRTFAGSDERVVVKMDIEGAEYPVLAKMVEDGTDAIVSELLVEWHQGHAAEGEAERLVAGLSCQVGAWWM